MSGRLGLRWPAILPLTLVAVLLPAAAGGSAAPALSIRATRSTRGYVGIVVTGPPGARVRLSEQLSGGATPIEVLQLSAAGTATAPKALTWLCRRLVRQLVATTLAPAAPATASAMVTTPSCARRLAWRIASRATAGRSIVIRLRDRWRLGGLPVRICVTPPGGRLRCRRVRLGSRVPSRVVRIPVPRPGGWRIRVRTRYSSGRNVVVWVRPAGGRIRLLAAGDSEMQILDSFIGQDLRRYRVSVTSDARISAGLTNSFFFNWPRHARRQAATLRPDVTVFFLGANDGFAVHGPGGRLVVCCGPVWSDGYANLVAEMMRIYLRGNAGRVYWFVLPAPRPGNFQRAFDGVDAGIRKAARRFPGRVSLIDADAFFTPGNRYRNFMTYHGHGFVIHESDGVHLSTASDGVAATLLVRQLLADRVIR